MKDICRKKQRWILLKTFLQALFISFLLDFTVAFTGKSLSVVAAILIFFAVFFFFAVLNFKRVKQIKQVFCVIALLVLLIITICAIIWGLFLSESDYHSFDYSDKGNLFGEKNVMLIVPHEDDDLNVLGGLIEQYCSYGSKLRVVFTTNGDFYGLGEKRICEALKVLQSFGVSEDNIIFLGYGDRMSSSGGSFYNAIDPDELLTAKSGHTATYGIEGHAPYHEGNLYTKRNIYQDLKDVILQYKPDTIFCVDYDSHFDHRATSLLFEELICQILKENETYTPVILKGFAYSTAYYGKQDFYDDCNIKSTVKETSSPYMDESNVYMWSDRIRLPVAESSLSRSIIKCDIYHALKDYKTQDAIRQVTGIINGDRVFWERYTTSLCRNAQIKVSSGYGEKLNDFRLADDYYNMDDGIPIDGVWYPDEDDEIKSATVVFEKPQDIKLINLYDSPSLEDNILELQISFDNGDKILTGPLAENGSATEIYVNENNIQSFSIEIISTVGEKAGLTEIEAFSKLPEPAFSFIKLMDENENFAYDIWTENEVVKFKLYEYGINNYYPLKEEYTLSVSNDRCSASFNNDEILVSCPKGCSTEVTIQDSNGQLMDEVFVQHPNTFMKLGFKIEKGAYSMFHENYKLTACYRILHTPYSFLRTIVQST